MRYSQCFPVFSGNIKIRAPRFFRFYKMIIRGRDVGADFVGQSEIVSFG
jgi:hypothetical protein